MVTRQTDKFPRCLNAASDHLTLTPRPSPSPPTLRLICCSARKEFADVRAFPSAAKLARRRLTFRRAEWVFGRSEEPLSQKRPRAAHVSGPDNIPALRGQFVLRASLIRGAEMFCSSEVTRASFLAALSLPLPPSCKHSGRQLSASGHPNRRDVCSALAFIKTAQSVSPSRRGAAAKAFIPLSFKGVFLFKGAAGRRPCPGLQGQLCPDTATKTARLVITAMPNVRVAPRA